MDRSFLEEARWHDAHEPSVVNYTARAGVALLAGFRLDSGRILAGL
jgi:hypothetical protein